MPRATRHPSSDHRFGLAALRQNLPLGAESGGPAKGVRARSRHHDRIRVVAVSAPGALDNIPHLDRVVWSCGLTPGSGNSAGYDPAGEAGAVRAEQGFQNQRTHNRQFAVGLVNELGLIILTAS